MAETIPELLEQATAHDADRVWLISGDEQFRLAETDDRCRRVHAWLADRGIRQGELVLLVAHNTATDMFAWLGIATGGAVVVAVNPKSTVDELAGFVAQTRSRVVVHDPAYDTGVTEAISRARTGAEAVAVTDLLAPDGSGRKAPSIRPDDPAVLIPTSGTTGRSKLVTQTHRAYAYAADGFGFWLGLTEDDRCITSLPIFHLNAPAYSLLGSMAAGLSVVLLPSFSASGFLDAARRYGATQFNSIGSMLELLMRQPERPDDADNPLRLCYTGPSPTRQRHLEIERRFGMEVTCGYALSESPYGMIWPRRERPFGTLGVPRQHPTLGRINDARVTVDDPGGERRPAGTGEVGELELRNPVLMPGYYEMPDETAEVLVDGWLRTGDLVTRDTDGYYTFVGRRKEVIRRRGENLSPLEVEEALEGHPDIAEAAVVAVPSELGEDDVKAFLLAAPGATPDLSDVRASLVGKVARYKIPRYLELVDDFPRTPTGRTAKHRFSRDRSAAEVDFDAPRPDGGDRR